jgi:TRAP-type C4-dicarboxylate transport system substrate-binding protein
MKIVIYKKLLIIGFVLLVLFIVGKTKAASIKVATIAPRGTTFHNKLEELNAEWSKAPGEPVRMNIYAGTQGGEVAIVKRMRINQLQGAMLTAVGLSQIDESVTALQLMPMQFQTWDEVDYVRNAIEEKLENIFLEKGYVVLFWGDAGWARFFTKEPIQGLDELRSMRIATMGGNSNSIELLKNYYTPVIIDPSKTLLALKNGMVEGVPVAPFLANATQLSTEAHYMLDMKWVPIVGAMVLTKRSWDRLPADTQVYLKESSRELGKKLRKISRQEDEDSIKAMVEKQGLIVNSISDATYSAWMKEIDRNQSSIRGNVVPADVYDQVMQHLKEYRNQASTL